MPNKDMVFDGFGSTDEEYSLFYFENDAKADRSAEDKARPTIKYLRGHAFQFFLQKLTVQGELTDSSKSYEVVETAGKEEFGSRKR